eukprot:TRINITY_DN101480_c0_g1_i1.p1 TRINITY_DN101480_c0_g1~~TRINITY_DN101480_c0_g1_i1.p1  ORF type:complete len:187 (-),score=42.89 TRINITY_DN101480_c0_g1_i1:63-593(-)
MPPSLSGWTTVANDADVAVLRCPSSSSSAGAVGGDMTGSEWRTSILSGQRSSFAGQAGCLQQERPCPEVDFTRAAWYNARKGPRSKEGIAKHIECCHAIKRSQRAWARTQDMLDGNLYFKYCAFAPPPLEPLVEWIVRRWQGCSKSTEGEDEQSEEQDVSNHSVKQSPVASASQFL